MPRLFHVSENPDIKIFAPLPVPNADAGVTGNAVWAVDEKHLPNYLLPRDCPRVTYAITEETKVTDREKFFKSEEMGKRIIIVEERWIQQIQDTTLYLYEFYPHNFQLIDSGAGYYISRETEEVMSLHIVEDIFKELPARNAILKTLPNLWKTINEVTQSSLEFSIIRKRNALPPTA